MSGVKRCLFPPQWFFPQCDKERADRRLNFSNLWLRLYIQASSHRQNPVSKSRIPGHRRMFCLLYFAGRRTIRNTWPCFQATTDCLLQPDIFSFLCQFQDIGRSLSKAIGKGAIGSRILSRCFNVKEASWKGFQHPQGQIRREVIVKK